MSCILAASIAIVLFLPSGALAACHGLPHEVFNITQATQSPITVTQPYAVNWTTTQSLTWTTTQQ